MKAGLLLLLISAITWTQEPVFKTRAREVIVPVSVMTKAGKPVENLSEDDFRVFSDGKPQRARMVLRESAPLPVYAVIVLQLDEGSAPALAKVKKTASIISNYITNDMGIERSSKAALVTAEDKVRLLKGFTADPDILGDVFAKLSPKGSSARLLDGIDLACSLLKTTDRASRRVIVLISGSRDEGSAARFPDVVVKAQTEDIVIYTISYSALRTAFTQKASDISSPAPQPGLYDPNNHGGVNLFALPALLAELGKTNVAEALAQSTGGSHLKFTTLRTLERQLTTIGTDIHNRYILSFVPQTSQALGYHELSVKVRTRSESRIHARTGYWTAPE